MARKRIISPEFWTDEGIAKMSFQARLFYIGIWNFADDTGVLKANPKLLKAQVFPYDDSVDMVLLMQELASKIHWYEVAGEQYGLVRNFLRHQRIDRPTASVLPRPAGFTDDSTNARRTLDPKVSEDKVSENEHLHRTQKLITAWNAVAFKKCEPEVEVINISVELSRALLSQAPELDFTTDILGAVANYAAARKIPRTKAGNFRLIHFLQKIVNGDTVYLPKQFDIDHFRDVPLSQVETADPSKPNWRQLHGSGNQKQG